MPGNALPGDAQPQVGHHRGLLHDQFVAVVGRARMVQIKYEWDVMLGVILGSEVTLLERAVGPGPFARIVHLADQVIVIVFFADAAQVGGERSAYHVRPFAHRMTSQASS